MTDDWRPAISVYMATPTIDTPAWRSIAVATWSDALDRLGIQGVVRGLSWRSGATRMAGRAVTAREETGVLGSQPAKAFEVARVLEVPKAGEVLVVDMGGAEVSTFGGLAARAATRREVEGVLVDGGCRDLEEIRATGLRVCSRWVTPTSGRGRARVVEINGRITCGGVAVRPGDYVIADETGAVVVPSERFDEALALSRDLDRRDRAFAQALDAGGEFRQIADSLQHI